MPVDIRGTSVGIVVTPEVTLAAETRVRSGVVEVVSWGAIPTPPDSMDGAAIVDPVRVSGPIRSLKRDLNLREKSASFALFAPGYGMRVIRLPEVPENERRTLVRGELEDAAAVPVGGGGFDLLWVPVVTEDGKRQADVSAYFVHDQTIELTGSALRQGGYEIDSMEPASLAMFRAVVASGAARRPLALLCPSEKHSDLCVHDGEQIRLLRRIPAGWSDLYEAQVEEAAANRLLGDHGGEDDRPRPEAGVPTATGIWSEEGDFPEVTNDTPFRLGAPAPSPPPQVTFAMPDVGPTAALERSSPTQFLTSEVMRTLAFYSRENRDAPRPESLVIVGTATVVRDFRSVLQNTLPIPVSTADPMAALQVPAPSTHPTTADTSHLLLAAVGVALGAAKADPSFPLVDVSQQEQSARARRQAPVMLLAGMAGSTLWMVGAAIAAITLTFLEADAQSENSRVAAEITKVKEERAALLKASEIGNAAKEAYDKTNVPAAAVLGRVAGATIPGVSVSDVKVTTDGKVTVGGKAVNEARLQEFIVMLTQGKSIRGPIGQTIRIDAQGITFTVTGVFRSRE